MRGVRARFAAASAARKKTLTSKVKAFCGAGNARPLENALRVHRSLSLSLSPCTHSTGILKTSLVEESERPTERAGLLFTRVPENSCRKRQVQGHGHMRHRLLLCALSISLSLSPCGNRLHFYNAKKMLRNNIEQCAST